MRASGLFLLCCSVLAAQPDSAITREGPYWVQTVTGVVSVPVNGQLHVKTRGAVALRGQSTDSVQFKLKKRVQASSAEEAERLLHDYQLKTVRNGKSVSLVVNGQQRPGALPEMFLTAPAQLVHTTLTTQGGTVEAYDLAGTVAAESGGGRIQMDRIGSTVTARTGGGDIVLGDIGGDVRGYSGGGLIYVRNAAGQALFETAGGDIQVETITGPLRAATAGGSIRVVRAGASVTAKTAGGRINVLYAGGPVIAENSSGVIDVMAAKDVRCDALVGTVRVKNVNGTMQVQTGLGNIIADLFGSLLAQNSFLVTNQGDITVFIPSNLAVTVRAQNAFGGAGKIISDFPEIRVQRTSLRPMFAEGSLNGGGPMLQITAAGGNIYLRRQR